MHLVPTSYNNDDVMLLLKDISGLVDPLPTHEREKKIQAGTHYCEMLPIEYEPSEKYLQLYDYALEHFAKITADAVVNVAEKIHDMGKTVLVSLARAGLPAGIMIKHYLEAKYYDHIYHYGISIIRGKGIDKNAMSYILARHSPDKIIFVDGWTGKGAIQNQLKEALSAPEYTNIESRLAVIADPAGITDLCGTHDDFLIASSCLNSTVSGLISRTFLRSDIIGPDDFHGAVYYGNLAKKDKSYLFINAIEKHMLFNTTASYEQPKTGGLSEVQRIKNQYGISDINLIKPGIGETTRVLLRRVPHKILIAKNCDPIYIEHIIALAGEKNVPIEYVEMSNYRCCGLIENMPSDA